MANSRRNSTASASAASVSSSKGTCLTASRKPLRRLSAQLRNLAASTFQRTPRETTPADELRAERKRDRADDTVYDKVYRAYPMASVSAPRP